MMYKNQEGYADPTAGQALANIRREEKARLGYMPLVYICSPFRGDVEGNMRNEILRLRAVPARAAHCHASAVPAIHGNKGNAADPRAGIAHGADSPDAL